MKNPPPSRSVITVVSDFLIFLPKNHSAHISLKTDDITLKSPPTSLELPSLFAFFPPRELFFSDCAIPFPQDLLGKTPIVPKLVLHPSPPL